MTIYFDENKVPSNTKPNKCICSITDAEWAYYSEHPDEWDIIKGKFKDLKNTKEYKKKQEEKYIENFNKEFFLTSKGYIRRKVRMADGSTRDFLGDVLHGLKVAVELGVETKVITYDMPPYNTDKPIECFQHEVVADMDLVKECYMQVSLDWKTT